MSVPFDRAVEYYDRTRALPPPVHERVVGVLVAELSGRGPVLEVGIGTGRIGLSLGAAGIDLLGLDLSRPMMERLVANAADAGAAALPLVEGDVTALPVRTGGVGAVLAVHVLHLVAGWEGALAELARVVGPGGTVLVARAAPGEAQASLFDPGDHLHGAAEIAEVDEGARRLGLGVRLLEPVRYTEPWTPKASIDMLAARRFGWTWTLTDEELDRIVTTARRTALDRFGSLVEPVANEHSVAVHAYDVR